MFYMNFFQNRVDETMEVKIVDKILPNFDMKFIYALNLTKQNGLIMFNTNNLLLVNM
jgi:hypothetical protein